jgi:hypothetical protein
MHLELRILVVATLVAVLSGHALVRGALQVPRPVPAYALRGGLDPAGSVNQGDNDDGDNDDGDNDDDDNDNSFDDELDFPPSADMPERAPEPICSTPGQDTTFMSHDGKVTVRVFGSTPRPVQVVIFQVVNLHEAPLPLERLVGLLAYEIWASYCDVNRLAEFPAEVNLGIRYTDLDAIGLDENRFAISRLDLNNTTWVPVEKQANDPPANYVSATIIDTGFYMVWEAR